MHRILLLLLGLFFSAYAADISTLPMAGLKNPYGLCLGPGQALYVCDIDNCVIWRFKDGEARIVAGSGQRGYSGDGGPATRAELNEPYEVRFDREGNMFFVEMKNHLVRKVSARDQTISTVAGNGKPGFSGDGGSAASAQFNQPHSLQFDAAGNLYICDIGNHRVRKIDHRSGQISTFAGTGERKSTPDGASFATAPLNGPRAIDFDARGDLWLALREGNAIYRMDLKAGTIHRVAGTGEKGFKNGPALEATLSGPKGLSIARNGTVYFADTESHSIRRLRDGIVETVVGTGARGDGPDGDPTRCALARPHGIFVSGKIYLGDSENNKVRVLPLPR